MIFGTPESVKQPVQSRLSGNTLQVTDESDPSKLPVTDSNRSALHEIPIFWGTARWSQSTGPR